MKGLSFQDHSPAFARALSKLGGFKGMGWSATRVRVR